MRKELKNEPVHGYKVFNPDWTCSPEDNTKQYSCPGKFEEEVNPKLGKYGMHFCQKLVNCFSYYKFNPDNKVAAVIASGDVIIDDLNDLCCTNKLEIVRELSWEEVLRLVNIGNNCTGVGNVGHHNSGNYNSGDQNSGNKNSGCKNTGYSNTGDKNSGDWNTGANNIGDCNVGCNNKGDYNVGDWNESSFNIGCFNTSTKEPTIMLFNKPSDWSYRMWLNSKARFLLSKISVINWKSVDEMAEYEKSEYPKSETTGGHLIEPLFENQKWWDSLSDKDKGIIKAIPNFDQNIFYECTGISVE